MLKAWFTPTTLAMINIGTNNNNKHWTSMLRPMKPPEVATSTQNREEPRTGNRPLGIQPKAIDKAPSIGLDRVSQTPTFRQNEFGRISNCPGTKTPYAGDGVGSSGVKKGERGTSIWHEVPSAPDPKPRPEGVPDPSLVPRPEGTNDPNLLHKPRGLNDLTHPQGGDDTTAARATATPPREEIATHEGGPTGNTKEPEIGVPPRPFDAYASLTEPPRYT
ncbi:hypothetical protein PIB30_069532 [Stylosanthes scabra]|uniref:Uncharacterized protein n=1 Tax=Stylosanthes scabra TaxID=79078 RepID=A0ABU6TPT1_9FABA|nr:hypothetical protein [Stylosanthes scabra]